MSLIIIIFIKTNIKKTNITIKNNIKKTNIDITMKKDQD